MALGCSPAPQGPEGALPLLEQRPAGASSAALGAAVRHVSNALRRDRGLPAGVRGVAVSEVYDGGPAARAGLRPFDVIQAIDGVPIENLCGFARALAARPPGQTIVLALRRANEALKVEARPESAVAFATRACDEGRAWGCHALGELHAEGVAGVPRDLGRAATLYDRACRDGSAEACADFGTIFVSGGVVAKDEARAAELFTRACDDGSAFGCTQLGYLYSTGLGVPKSDIQGAVLFRRSCDGGDAMGCYNVGLMYGNGWGFLDDPGAAAAGYTQACAGGHSMGCTNLGYLYENGLGVARDEAKAFDLYQRGCNGDTCQAGDPTGCHNVGLTLQDGMLGVERDVARAAIFFERACDGGRGDACAALAKLYRSGEGVEASEERAVELFRRACHSGDDASCDEVEGEGEAGALE